ncbi:hypothetical protein [Patiriisocius sp. Uisw_017]|jgi:hypothetical protein|uniref:hypothetical protein n=1 Tax=Patiriisocius sp. Uisw_017 TaxID=3230968 RepID=UPI0039E99EFC
MKERIEFKKERELGTILSDTFKFLRLEGKALFGHIIRIAGPALFILVIAFVVYTKAIGNSFEGTNFLRSGLSYSLSLVFSLGLMIIAGLAYYGLLYAVVNHYIKSYIKNEGVVIKDEINQGVKNDFWSLIGLNILVALIVAGGMVFCFAPGIYFGVALSCVYSILILDKLDVSSTISYSFKLVKGEWWMTFATLFVVFLLFYVMVIVFQIPQYIYFFIQQFTIAETVSIDPSVMFDWTYTALNAVGLIGQYLGHTLITVATIFIYFNLNEKKNLSGTIEKIEAIGEVKE